MFSEFFVSKTIDPLSPSMNVGEAIKHLRKFHLDMLPVVENDVLVNYALIQNLESLPKETKLGDLTKYTTIMPFVSPEQHILDVLSHLKSLDLSLLAFLNQDKKYIGFIKTKDVVMELSQSMTINGQGSIVVVRMNKSDFSVADIVRIVEYNDVKVLGFLTFDKPEFEAIEVHLKLNTRVLRNVLATLERYNYNVVEYFNREDINDDNDWRYENLLKYIDL